MSKFWFSLAAAFTILAIAEFTTQPSPTAAAKSPETIPAPVIPSSIEAKKPPTEPITTTAPIAMTTTRPSTQPEPSSKRLAPPPAPAPALSEWDRGMIELGCQLDWRAGKSISYECLRFLEDDSRKRKTAGLWLRDDDENTRRRQCMFAQYNTQYNTQTLSDDCQHTLAEPGPTLIRKVPHDEALVIRFKLDCALARSEGKAEPEGCPKDSQTNASPLLKCVAAKHYNEPQPEGCPVR
jgi:hypothetical protein